MRYLKSALIPPVVLWIAGCGTYDTRFAYEPNPAEVSLIENDAEQQRIGRVLASIVGVRRDDSSMAYPNTVEVRVRIENGSNQTVTMDPATLRLLSGDLNAFSEPITLPQETVALEPADETLITAYFPFPDNGYPGDAHMQGLNLKWRMQVGERTVQRSITFDRREYRYYDRFHHTGRYRYGLGLWHCY